MRSDASAPLALHPHVCKDQFLGSFQVKVPAGFPVSKKEPKFILLLIHAGIVVLAVLEPEMRQVYRSVDEEGSGGTKGLVHQGSCRCKRSHKNECREMYIPIRGSPVIVEKCLTHLEADVLKPAAALGLQVEPAALSSRGAAGEAQGARLVNFLGRSLL